MKALSRFLVSLLLLLAFLSNALPCGPGYITPLFDTTNAPESPYSDFASGRLGIVKPELERSVLYAAYRYIAASGLNAAEQQAILEVWRAEIDNKDFRDDSVDAAVKAWVEKRKDVIGKEEKTPDIYAERSYGGYEFFPNCTKNAFETAAETLADRVSGHGPSDPNIGNWIKGQDEVFANCASGKQTPESAPPGAPDWLIKDRAYQVAAASFYSLDYNDAKRRFAEIAQDSDSPWQETADYLVARTLIRQASLSKPAEKVASFYDDAETHLERFTSRTGKFSDSAERLMGLIKYRRHPQERVSELAKKLSRSGDDNFRQDLIDYNWLLNKFQNEVLIAEDKRKEADKKAKKPSSDPGKVEDAKVTAPPTPQSEAKNDDDLELNLSSLDYSQNWKFYVKPDATDDDAIAAAERVVGQPLSDELKKRVREIRQSAYAGRFTASRPAGDDTGYYYGDDKLTHSLLPDFLRRDDLTDWLYTFEMMDEEAYRYSLNRFRETGSELWLMSAISKADKSSAGLAGLMEAANNSSATSPAYTTISYHRARLLLAQGKTMEGRKLIDAMLNLGDDLPVSARNSFLGLRVKLAETLEDFLTFSLKKPYGFDFDGESGSVDEFIARQKAEYNPEYNTDGREAYEQEIEDRYKEEKLWQGRPMFDSNIIETFNQQFSTATLQDVLKSPALPDYMRDRFVMAIWTRAFLLDDMATLLKITPELAKLNTDFEPLLTRITAAKTQTAMDNATLYFVIRNPVLSPYIEDGTGKADNEFGEFDSNDWWCAPYDSENDDSGAPQSPPPRPAFLTASQRETAQAERKRLKEIGDAPKFLGEKVMEWAKRSPTDRRVPEALYLMIQANGWTKYGCGNDEELRKEMSAYLRRHYPGSEWTVKLTSEDNDK